MVVGSENDGKDFMVFTDSPIDGTHIFRRWIFMAENFLEKDGYLDCVKYMEIECEFVGDENMCREFISGFIEAEDYNTLDDTSRHESNVEDIGLTLIAFGSNFYKVNILNIAKEIDGTIFITFRLTKSIHRKT